MLHFKLLILLFSVGIIACTSSTKRIEVSFLDTNKWVEDSLGIDGYRVFVKDSILKNYNVFKGFSQNEIKQLFGTPNIIKENSFLYFAFPIKNIDHRNSIRIMIKNGVLNNEIECGTIAIDFESGIVSSVGEIIC